MTLIELIAVVAVISLLAALLMPAVQKMRNSANAANCVGNLRQIGVALHSYIAENDGFFPPSYDSNPARDPSQALSNYIPDPASKLKLSNSKQAKPGATYRTAGVWWCPADNDPAKRPVAFAQYSYTVNAGLRNDASKAECKKYGVAKNTANLIYLIDQECSGNTNTFWSQMYSSSWPFAQGSIQNQPSPTAVNVAFRHLNFANALFVDGSVRQLSFKDIAGTTINSGNSRYVVPLAP